MDYLVVLIVGIVVAAFFYFIGMPTLAPWIGFVVGAVAWGIIVWQKRRSSAK